MLIACAFAMQQRAATANLMLYFHYKARKTPMTLTNTSHRPWPVPPQPWIMAMEWHDLLFMHWPVAPAQLRAFVPPHLTLETWAGAAWLGVVPFRMAGVRPRWLPAVPWFSAFPELNLRTYVVADGKPGVWFFSLDAGNPVAVELARLAFHLPYFAARMTAARGSAIGYTSRRTHHHAPPAAFQARYAPTGPVAYAAAGTLDHWLTERYCLYAADQRGHVWRGDIHHAPWPLQPARAATDLNTLAVPFGIALTGPPLLHFARRLDVVAWLPERLR